MGSFHRPARALPRPPSPRARTYMTLPTPPPDFSHQLLTRTSPTMVLQITPADVAYQKAHKDDDRSGALYATAATMIVLPTIAVILRLACRRHLQAPISHDDIAIIVALVSIAPLQSRLIPTVSERITIRVQEGFERSMLIIRLA
ncbi:MAG: hypothetical protein LQ339_007546 [Xanthoria mediterranea]|nr:MAG: hypothetical protein LQ339_007546 [Xanthoria mediterranea]